MSTNQRLGLLAALPGLTLSIGIVLTVLTTRPHSLGPVYTVAALHAHLADDPQVWVGRTVWVRGRSMACQLHADQGHLHCLPAPSRLEDPIAATVNMPLLLEAPEPLQALLRRVPLLGGLLPAQQAVAWWRVATYRVRLRAVPVDSCTFRPCYEALLLDAAPDAPGD